MKLLHLSDLHIGKRVNDFSMLEDQEYIFVQYLNIIDEKNIDGVMIAGDVYDKPIPAAEAVALFDSFLTRLAARKIPVFIVSGNHDSAERLAFGARLMRESHIYLSPAFDGSCDKISLSDEYGAINFYLLPFIKPAHVRKYFPDAEAESYNDAVRTVVDAIDVDTSERNVLIAHQFVTGAAVAGSEEMSVGGIENVDTSVFEIFDYTALGHIHSSQSVGCERIRYGGTPLKYSLSEISHVKTALTVELGAKGEISFEKIPLFPLHDMRCIKGTYTELVSKKNYEGTAIDDYIHVILTDEEDVPDAIGRLRTVYPNIMKLEYDNARTRSGGTVSVTDNIKDRSPIELVSEFFMMQNGACMNEKQQALCCELIERIWEDEK